MTVFSDRLKELMKIRGVSLGDIIRAAKIPKSSAHAYVSGSCTPRLETLCMFADILNVSIDTLVGRREITGEEGNNKLPETVFIKKRKGRGKDKSNRSRPIMERTYVLRKGILEALNENPEGLFASELKTKLLAGTGRLFHTFSINRGLNVLLRNDLIEKFSLQTNYGNIRANAARYRLKREE